MPQDPFPNRGPDGEEPDGEEPDGSGPLPAGRDGSADHDPVGLELDGLGSCLDDESEPGSTGQGPEQGLFVCLPAEELTLAGFAQNGRADTMAPGALLATVLEAITGENGSGLAGLSDNQLVGALSGARRLEARIAWMQMAALAELARRRPPTGEPADTGEAGFSDFAADEVAAELHLTSQSATNQIWYACDVADRLPRSFAALAAGRIHPVHLRIIQDETAVLSPQDAARADAQLAEMAGSMTFGRLRAAAHRLVLRLDPDAARRRKEAARQDAHVRRFREDSGNAGMIARELPPAEVLASWQHVEQRALDLRAAGMPGTLTELRVRAYLDLLQERDSRDVPACQGTGQVGRPPGQDGDEDSDGPQDHDNGPGGTGVPGSGPQCGPGRNSRPGSGPQGGPGGTGVPGSGPQCGPGGNSRPGSGPQGGPGGTGVPGSGPQCGPGGNSGPGSGPQGGPGDTGSDGRARPGPDPGPSVAALVNITVPLETVLGLSAVPGEAAGFGLLDTEDARDLVAAAARHPQTRWCVTALHPDGTAAAHGCAVGRWYPPPPGPASSGRSPGPGPGPPPGGAPRDYLASLRIRMVSIARGGCDHAQAEAGYRPSRRLQHLVRARNVRCTAPGCGRPAARCDLDHTVAWDQGGLTCECGLAPLCRHHHRCKQADGWWLEQPEPGVLRWRTPAGRTYTTTPTAYAI